ncbi:leucine-rich repeat-containing protein kinase family protein [Pedobacter sp. AW1-32]|uniref:leucine-rich repeat-containing protein kinase family protein n=1 Tax=Pedobacter sp. AW1-32 TaxID=3383026 RepID=UPI003FED4242
MHTLKQLISGQLGQVKSLKISENLNYFPQEIFSLADTLEVLDLSGNSISVLPENFGLLKNLRILFCSDNQFKELPSVLGDCPLLEIVGFKSNQIESIAVGSLNPNLKWLILTNNKLTELPAEIGHCFRMQKLMLAGNQLSVIPVELQSCQNLGLLRISANRLKVLPSWLLEMPKLAWIAFSGNDFNIITHVISPPTIPLEQLTFGTMLGEGASGTIFRTQHNNGTTVAVKIFKGSVTSDGFPLDEMNAYIAAGTHFGLVKLLGQVILPEQAKQGLVMELIPDCFYNLGNPPSLQSCTRDIFSDEIKLTLQQVFKIAGTIASVGQHLHSKGVLHGDLYAHNILIDQDGNALFGDFGAASIYSGFDKDTALNLQRIEVLAFGYLLEDLEQICTNQDQIKDNDAYLELTKSCLIDVPAQRPTFQQIVAVLDKLTAELQEV